MHFVEAKPCRTANKEERPQAPPARIRSLTLLLLPFLASILTPRRAKYSRKNAPLSFDKGAFPYVCVLT